MTQENKQRKDPTLTRLLEIEKAAKESRESYQRFLDVVNGTPSEEMLKVAPKESATEDGIAVLARASAACGGVQPHDLEGMKWREAIRYIVDKSEGEFRVTQARRLMVAAHVVPNTRSAGNELHRLLTRMQEMKWVRRNLWVLKGRLQEPWVEQHKQDDPTVFTEADEDWLQRATSPVSMNPDTFVE